MRNIKWELEHRFLQFSGPSIPPGLSAADRERLLEKESELARIRDEEQREFLDIQERQRVAREESQRTLAQQEEAARLAEIERLETEGADVAETLEDPEDIDTTVADMFASLAFGTEFVSDVEEEESLEEERPE